MEATEDLAAGRIRECPARRAPWTHRCRLTGRNVVIDVDAFSAGEASSLAAAHWGVEHGEVAVDGQRRRWMRWIGISTHEAVGRRVAMDRNWWYTTKLVATNRGRRAGRPPSPRNDPVGENADSRARAVWATRLSAVGSAVVCRVAGQGDPAAEGWMAYRRSRCDLTARRAEAIAIVTR